MPAYTRFEPSALIVQFERDGEEPEQKLAHGGWQALLYAVGILIGHSTLVVGDRLTVMAADVADDIPTSPA
jgi:hypothetical protein